MTESLFTPHASRVTWNQSLMDAPARCDALVIGAGPAGSSCAITLARAGLQVILVDAQAFPRDKVCGDGLVPDTMAALKALGLLEQVLARAQKIEVARCVAPSGSTLDVPGNLAMLPRKELDALLCAAAVDAGAFMVAPAKFTQLRRNDLGRVMGAELRMGELRRWVEARWVVLATGAGAAPLLAAGVCEQRAPSALAVRRYVRHPGLDAERQALRFVWHSDLKGGYGWVFPGPNGLFNIGAGVLDAYVADGFLGGRQSGDKRQARRRSSPNLREFFDRFSQADPLVAKLLSEGETLGPLEGAPLRCDLGGARWSEPGLLVCGDAAGSTYAFTGEGIGKAMETGIAAARALRFEQEDDAAVQANYHASLNALLPRFALYRKAATFNHHPWWIEAVIWRARRSERLLKRLSDVLHERRMPGSLWSWRGLKAMIRG